MATPQLWSNNEDVCDPTLSFSTISDLQIILFRVLVRTALATRPVFYAEPALERWSGNRGSNINNKIQQLLEKFGATVPGAADVVKEEVAALSNKKSTPTQSKTKSSASTPKKRKVVKSEDDESRAEFSE
jgi:hypothetical protein